MNAGTKAQIRFIVDRLHVSASDDAVRVEIRCRAECMRARGASIQDRSIRAWERYAVEHHGRNRSLYAWVMGGLS